MTGLHPSLPTVDVVIPAYNAETFIAKTLESVAKQSYPIQSVIVVNDGSIDDTQARILQCIQSFPHLNIILINQNNAGLSAARNAGIRRSGADYIALLDADDLWSSEKLSNQVQLFSSSPMNHLGLVYCAYLLINEQDQLLPSTPKSVIAPALRGNVYQKLLLGNFISGSGSSVLIKRSVFSETGLFDEDLRACEDWDMWMRIAKKYQFDFISDPLVSIRVHQNNMQKDAMRMLSAELMVLNKFAECGEENTFLLWKIRTYLMNKGLNASSIPGFEKCCTKLQSQLRGWRMDIASTLLAPLRTLANNYLNQKHK